MWFGVAFARERSLINTQPYHSYTVNNQAKQKMSKEFWKRKDSTFTRFLYPCLFSSFFPLHSTVFYLICFYFYFLLLVFWNISFSIYLLFSLPPSLKISCCFTFIRFSFHPASFYDSRSLSLHFQYFSFSNSISIALSLFFFIYFEISLLFCLFPFLFLYLFFFAKPHILFYLAFNFSS